jgi:hypothetical protein
MNNKMLKMAFAGLVLSISGFANAGLITTGFSGNMSCGSCGNFFDVTIFDSDITLESLEVNIGSAQADILVYLKSGTYTGFESNAASWTLMSTSSVTGQGQGFSTFVDIMNFTLSANSNYGMYIMQTVDENYYDGISQTISNSDLQLSLGTSGINNFSTILYSPRTWNGTINYTAEVPEPSTLAILGLGLMGLASRRFKKKS